MPKKTKVKSVTPHKAMSFGLVAVGLLALLILSLALIVKLGASNTPGSIGKVTVGKAMILGWRPHVEGIEHIPNTGRCIVVANHSGTLPLDGLVPAARTEPPAGHELPAPDTRLSP